ncbi:hypothetical protein L1887_39684 [Cichorium endivia]|nr:hypothetical protein L1887_39684 [Cichorium endivia]
MAYIHRGFLYSALTYSAPAVSAPGSEPIDTTRHIRVLDLEYRIATNGSGGGQQVSSEAFPSNPRERKERDIAKIRTHGQVIRMDKK